jgi:hypothetical protein
VRHLFGNLGQVITINWIIGFDDFDLDDPLSLKPSDEFGSRLGRSLFEDHRPFQSSLAVTNHVIGSSRSCFDDFTKSRIIRFISAVMLVRR